VTGQRLGSQSWRSLATLDASLLVVPLGATEQHGPHLPLDADTRIASAWADRVAARLPGAVVAPPLPYGSSGEHQGFSGTLSIGQQALRGVLIELVRSARHSFELVVLLSGHAGNAEPVTTAVTQLRHEGHRLIALFPTWDERAVGSDVDAHAGRVETSLLLHLAPETVELDMAAVGNTEPLDALLDDLRSGGVASVSPNGVLGDPAGASPAEGQRLLDDLVDRAVAATGEYLRSHADL